MFRIRNYVMNVKYLLQQHQRLDVYVSSIHQYNPVQYKIQIRETCPEKPPLPPPKPKDDSAFWGAMAVLFMTGGFVVIAKRSPEIRDWLTIHAPWLDDLIAIAYEENMTYKDFAQKCVEDVKDYFYALKDAEKVKPCSLEEDGSSQNVVEDRKDESIEPDTESCNEKEPPPPVVVTKSVCEIIERVNDCGNEALSNYYTASEACAFYNKQVAETLTSFSISALRELHCYMAERLKLVCESIKNAEQATAEIDDLVHYLECGATGSKEDMESAKQLLSDYLQKIKGSCMQYQWENDKSTVLDIQWQKVETLVNKYIEENESMFPEIKYEQKKLQFKGDIDLLLHHTSKYLHLARSRLKEESENMMERIDRAYETLSKGDKEQKQREAMLRATLKEARAAMDKEFQKREEEQRKENENILKESLRKQLERHQDTMEKRLAQKEKQATMKLEKLIAEKVAYEKKLMESQLAEMSAKVKVVEDKLTAHLKVESEIKRSQELWVAGAALLAATQKGEPCVKVNKELNAIEKASGDGDKLVTSVLKAIPDSVREKGVVPDSIIRKKYHQMESVALKVALVEQEGAPLPVYFLSWIQSTLLFLKLSGIPQQEIDKPPQEPFKDLDTFDLLQRARFWLERGNLAAAIRYVNSLEGASRSAADSWYVAATSHLETKQAALAILTHAAAIGLQYI